MIILIILIIFSIIILLWQISNFISIFYGSLYVKTNKDIISFALNKVNIKNSDVFYELGCGSGDVLLKAENLGALVTGFEISPFYFLMSRIRTIKNKNIKVLCRNINNVDLRNADVVYCYLLPNFLKNLSPKFLKEKPKKIISISFEIPGLPNQKTYKFKNRLIYIYSFN